MLQLEPKGRTTLHGALLRGLVRGLPGSVLLAAAFFACQLSGYYSVPMLLTPRSFTLLGLSWAALLCHGMALCEQGIRERRKHALAALPLGVAFGLIIALVIAWQQWVWSGPTVLQLELESWLFFTLFGLLLSGLVVLPRLMGARRPARIGLSCVGCVLVVVGLERLNPSLLLMQTAWSVDALLCLAPLGPALLEQGELLQRWLFGPPSREGVLELRGNAELKRLGPRPGLRRLRLQADAGLDLSPLQRLPGLEELDLSGVRLRPRELAVLKDLPALRLLRLNGCGIGDAGLQQLAGCALQHLEVRQCQLSDASSPVWSQLPGLLQLDLSDNRVADATCSALAGLPRLRALQLCGTRVGVAGLQALGELADLAQLDLSQTRIDDQAGLALKALSQLESLSLRGTRLGDGGLAAIAGMPALRRLQVAGSRVSPSALRRLKKSRPELKLR